MRSKSILVVMVMMVLFGVEYAQATWITLDKPGATYTRFTGIDGSNIVGNYYDTTGEHGLLYNGTDWTTLDFPTTGNILITGIDGSDIVGRYVDDLGGVHGFVYTIPEPATLLLLGLGAVK